MLLCSTVPPSQPTDVFIQSTDVGPTFTVICWQLPAFRGIPEVSRYVVTATQTDGGADPLTFFTDDAIRDFNVTELAPGTRYKFQVAAISEYKMIVGRSPLSDPAFVNTTYTGKASFLTSKYA